MKCSHSVSAGENPTQTQTKLGSADADAVGEFLKCPDCPLPPTPTPKMGAGEPELSKSLSQAWERDLGRGPSRVTKYFANSIR